MTLWICVGLVTVLVFVRFYSILPACHKITKRLSPCKAMIFLGSGGHTEEMVRLLHSLDVENYQPRLYVMANNDQLSDTKAIKLEQSLNGDHDVTPVMYKIPRARNVGQSLLSVPLSFSRAFLYAFKVVYLTMPDVIICNGPGSCLPLCIAAYILRFFGRKYITLIYVESFARVNGLSITGRLLYRWVDLFLVQWPGLVKKYPKAMYLGPLI
ncbi:UDP-N-acetylglucosamine transferase subunit ALG14 [Hesseltinella vesiculosa]|uniref:UDP-N-acetylglucosamine transferase subunit ALG14 n=1 Tax=Hesseltinella vesiculosa TaxID=101127 RepID=A0A1X2G749_9FUNG|nr:UDP-N-acetylglucosamine transferase subunit ALG14 [Hesseltinella vesiculosa]